jgi:hypothetical protein
VKAPPPPQDVRFKSTYTNGEMKTESVTYIKGARERYEFQDMVLLKQPDQKRTVQISKSANTYLVAPEGMTAPVVPGAAPAAPPKPPGVIMVATTIVDTGERKSAFGQQARHVKMMIDKQPMPGACDAGKMRIETDGWYIDNPPSIANRPASSEQAAPSPDGCTDQIQATSNGDPKVLGFPIAYTTTLTGDDGKPVVSTMEVTEFEATTLDPALFEIPGGFNAVMNIRELSKALSDANEAKLVAANAAPPAAPAPKTAGVVRIAVPEFTNKTQQTVDTRALRQRLLGDLTEAKFEAVPMPAGTPAELQKRAGEMGADFVLFAEVSELKVNKPSAFGGLMKAAGGVAGGRAGVAGSGRGCGCRRCGRTAKGNHRVEHRGEARSARWQAAAVDDDEGQGWQRLQLEKRPRHREVRRRHVSEHDGRPDDVLEDGRRRRLQQHGRHGHARQPVPLSNAGRGLERSRQKRGYGCHGGAAAHMMQTGMAMNNLGGFVGVPGQGPSYDESLGEAVQNAAKAVQKSLEKK